MTWKLHDEWIDLQQSRHVVIYKNADTGAEHHLINLFGLESCPTCGHTMNPQTGHEIDFHKMKTKRLEELNHHHRKVTGYREKHPHVRVGVDRK